MKKLLPLLLILLMASCCRFIPKRCLTHSTDTLTFVDFDTIVIFRDTTITIEVPVPYEVQGDSIPYPVYIGRTGLINSDTLFLHTSFANSYSFVSNSILKGSIENNDTIIEIQRILKNALKESTIYRDSLIMVRDKTTIVQKRYTKTKWILIAIIVILGLVLAIKLIDRR